MDAWKVFHLCHNYLLSEAKIKLTDPNCASNGTKVLLLLWLFDYTKRHEALCTSALLHNLGFVVQVRLFLWLQLLLGCHLGYRSVREEGADRCVNGRLCVSVCVPSLAVLSAPAQQLPPQAR